MLNLSVIVPVYNEEASLFENISLLESTLGKAGRIKSYQIIIVDDGSRDRSFQIAKTLAENNVNINIIGHEKNSGIGKAGNAGLG